MPITCQSWHIPKSKDSFGFAQIEFQFETFTRINYKLIFFLSLQSPCKEEYIPINGTDSPERKFPWQTITKEKPNKDKS